MRLYKVLKVNTVTWHRLAPYQGTEYDRYLPRDGKPGPWTRKVRGPLRICRRGYHLTTAPKALIRSNMGGIERPSPGIAYEVYVAEGRGAAVRGALPGENTKLAFESIRLIKRAKPWFEIPNRLTSR